MTKNYDFKQISVTLGKDIISGFADGDDAVSIEFSEDMYKLLVGADGETSRARSNNLSAKITIKLQQTSAANDILNAYFLSDRAANTGKFPIMIKDLLGSELHACEEAWISKAPSAQFGASVPIREWVLETGKLTSTYGGAV